jgi:hypothetical protein
MAVTTVNYIDIYNYKANSDQLKRKYIPVILKGQIKLSTLKILTLSDDFTDKLQKKAKMKLKMEEIDKNQRQKISAQINKNRFYFKFKYNYSVIFFNLIILMIYLFSIATILYQFYGF